MAKTSLRLSMKTGDAGIVLVGDIAAAQTAAERIERCLAWFWQRPASRADALELRKLGKELAERVLPESTLTRLTAESDLPLILADPDRVLPLEMGFLGTQFLGLRHAIGREWGTDGENAEEPADTTGLLRGGIIADSQFNLLYSQYEAQDVCRLWRQSGAFHEIEVLSSHVCRDEALGLIERCDWLHVCGHAIPKDEQRGWVFRDGRLFPETLLSAGLRRVPQWIFANACQSAPRRIDGVAAWTDAFEQLGARHYLGTAVPIPDAGTFPFVETVYRKLLKGETVGSAVLAGRQALAASEGPNGLLWACYLLFGDPSARLWKPMADNPFQGSALVCQMGNFPPVKRPVAEEPITHCDICGQPLYTRHGLADTDIEGNASQSKCRICARRESQSDTHVDGTSTADQSMTRNISTESNDLTDSCVDDPLSKSVPTGWRDFATRWTQAVERFRAFRDPETGRDFAVRLVPDCQLKWLGQTASYLLKLDDGTSPKHWPRLLLDLGMACDPTEPRQCSIDDFKHRLNIFAALPVEGSRVIALGTSSGWAPEVVDLVWSDTWRSTDREADWSIVLFDQTSKSFGFSDCDNRAVAFRDLFDLETDGEKIRRAVDSIGRLRPLEVSLSVETLVRQIGLPESILVPAMCQAAEEFGLHLDDVPGYGWVISS